MSQSSITNSVIMKSQQWASKKSWDWYKKQPWLVGCNFAPSTAINQLEMWQAETFDIPTIRHELELARGLGFNVIRVYLHNLLWETDANGFKNRIDTFLASSKQRSINFLCADKRGM